eukprot:TRINITY_DN4604_c0_g1_i1.p1 TRINITY_DN4604_c0_g1~~TRINITY_DN4604_c0_g1_i1.p1  ORF type:complete len:295 (+),score=71.70 TRINITY_DN4604_c0_g1_i1:181-1065(+)
MTGGKNMHKKACTSIVHHSHLLPLMSDQVGLIVLGNSGVGKSWLVNLFLGENTFEHRYAASAVTKATEFEEMDVKLQTGKTVRAAIFNIPGLIENDQRAIDKNKEEIQKAFALRPISVIVFVLNTSGGRVRDEDVVAFQALNSAYQLKPESLCIVVNQLSPRRHATYEAEVTIRLESLFRIRPLRIAFINELDGNDEQGLAAARSSLVQVIDKCLPREHAKHHDIHLQADLIEQAKAETKALQQKLNEEMKNMKAEIDKRQKEIEELRNAPPRVIERHHYHSSGGGGRRRCLIM